MTKKEEIISEIAKRYNLPSSLPDISDPKVLEKINVRVLEDCMEDLEAAERIESASMAHAHEVWTW